MIIFEKCCYSMTKNYVKKKKSLSIFKIFKKTFTLLFVLYR